MNIFAFICMNNNKTLVLSGSMQYDMKNDTDHFGEKSNDLMKAS